MIRTNSSNIAQIEYWNTEAGETWTKFQEALDARLKHWVWEPWHFNRRARCRRSASFMA